MLPWYDPSTIYLLLTPIDFELVEYLAVRPSPSLPLSLTSATEQAVFLIHPAVGEVDVDILSV